MLKKYALATVAAAVACSAGPALASGTTTVNVTTTISAVCKFTAGSMTDISLGTVDPSAVPSTGVTGTTDVTYQCTNGTSPTISFALNGSGQQMGGTTLTNTLDPTKTISYTFSMGSAQVGTGFASGATGTKAVATATISQAAAQAASAGSYSDTVTLAVNY